MRGNLDIDPESGQVLLGQPDGRYMPRTMSGDATIDNDGVVTVQGGGGVTYPIATNLGGTGTETQPSVGQILAAASATEYVPISISGDIEFTGPGVVAVTKISDVLASYDGIPCVGLGVPVIVAVGADENLSADMVSATIFFNGTSQHLYEINFYLVISQVASDSSTLPIPSVTYTDWINHTEVTLSFVNTSTSSLDGNTLSTTFACHALILVDDGSSVAIATIGYASSGATAMQYTVAHVLKVVD